MHFILLCSLLIYFGLKILVRRGAITSIGIFVGNTKRSHFRWAGQISFILVSHNINTGSGSGASAEVPPGGRPTRKFSFFSPPSFCLIYVLRISFLKKMKKNAQSRSKTITQIARKNRVDLSSKRTHPCNEQERPCSGTLLGGTLRPSAGAEISNVEIYGSGSPEIIHIYLSQSPNMFSPSGFTAVLVPAGLNFWIASLHHQQLGAKSYCCCRPLYSCRSW